MIEKEFSSILTTLTKTTVMKKKPKTIKTF